MKILWCIAIDLARLVDAATSLLSLGFAGTCLAHPVSVACARYLSTRGENAR